MMMMLFAPNFVVCQMKVLRSRRKEEAGGRRKAGSTGTPASGADAPIGLTRSGVSDVRNRRKHGRSCSLDFLCINIISI